MLFGVQDSDAVTLDGFPSLVANLLSGGGFDFLFHVTLSSHIDQFLTCAIFQMQLVEALAVR